VTHATYNHCTIKITDHTALYIVFLPTPQTATALVLHVALMSLLACVLTQLISVMINFTIATPPARDFNTSVHIFTHYSMSVLPWTVL
jgi:hypothetical protein